MKFGITLEVTVEAASQAEAEAEAEALKRDWLIALREQPRPVPRVSIEAVDLLDGAAVPT